MAKDPILRTYDLQSRLWTGPQTHIAVLSDLHMCGRWTTPASVRGIVDRINDLRPDLILLPGDFLVRLLLGSQPLAADHVAEVMARLSAPLGVFASLGNHDWKDCAEARANGFVATSVTGALERVGIPVLVNTSLPLQNGAWLVGLDSQQGHGTARNPIPRHDAQAAFADVPEGAPTIVMAHEPDWFLENDRPYALQVSGHTHGGQVSLMGWRPLTASRYAGRLAYGLHSDGERHLVVSAGLGYSILPIRYRVPSEIVSIRLAAKT